MMRLNTSIIFDLFYSDYCHLKGNTKLNQVVNEMYPSLQSTDYKRNALRVAPLFKFSTQYWPVRF